MLQAIDFLDKLLRYDHQERLTAREAMVSSILDIYPFTTSFILLALCRLTFLFIFILFAGPLIF